MATKFELEMQGRAERAIRDDNINKINGMIQECEDLLAVMPNTTPEETQEVMFVRSRVAWLHDLKADEQRAYNATMTANADDVVNLMRH